jgi:hypothetical protein
MREPAPQPEMLPNSAMFDPDGQPRWGFEASAPIPFAPTQSKDSEPFAAAIATPSVEGIPVDPFANESVGERTDHEMRITLLLFAQLEGLRRVNGLLPLPNPFSRRAIAGLKLRDLVRRYT